MPQQIQIDVILTLEDGPINASAMRESVRFFLQGARRDGQITPEDDQEHAMLTDVEVRLVSPGLELPRMLVLSTSHLRQETAQLLEADEAGVIRHEKGEYGWIIPIIDNPSNEPPPNLTDLVGIYGLARSVGATWIMLDRDADTVDGLETWEW
ncbi:hypothetical protein [Methylorubrum populi]|uniref:DUF5983 family protein n=1 Tax=Methylorubrum populi TaxID=223967 RepID=UPI000DB25741|nr:hypothetical protein [Methylorubrum populi]PZP71801.1 MAG: hypothetical protein DI590_05940 [Methylorubrum populi]